MVRIWYIFKKYPYLGGYSQGFCKSRSGSNLHPDIDLCLQKCHASPLPVYVTSKFRDLADAVSDFLFWNLMETLYSEQMEHILILSLLQITDYLIAEM